PIIDALGQDADDPARDPVERKRSPHDAGLALEAGGPESVREQDDVVAALLVLFGEEVAAEPGGDAQRGEEPRADDADLQALRMISARESRASRGPGAGICERLHLGTEIEKLRHRCRDEEEVVPQEVLA